MSLYKCETCDKDFTERDDFDVHMKSLHSDAGENDLDALSSAMAKVDPVPRLVDNPAWDDFAVPMPVAAGTVAESLRNQVLALQKIITANRSDYATMSDNAIASASRVEDLERTISRISVAVNQSMTKTGHNTDPDAKQFDTLDEWENDLISFVQQLVDTNEEYLRANASLTQEYVCSYKAGKKAFEGLSRWKKTAGNLWRLLDDIDTISDATRGDLTAYYHRAAAKAQDRNRYIVSDGHKLFEVTPEGIDPEPMEEQ